MSEYEHLLSVQDLHTTFTTDNGLVQAVNGVSFNLDERKVLGIVGESGSGKSVTAYSVMQILAENGGITGKAVSSGKPETAAKRVKASAGLRLIGMGVICALLIGLVKTNPFATLIPLLFPRISLLFRPMIDRKRGVQSPDTEGSDLIE